MPRLVLITGGFDPIHSGHIEYINAAKELGDYLFVGLNSDEWLTRKKSKPFMPFEERKMVLNQFKDVLCVIGFDDSDGSACDAIQKAKEMFPKNKIIFVNGGDRTSNNIPEMNKFLGDSQVDFVFGIGGEDKKNSSSWILQEWKAPKTQRPWGYYRVLHEVPGVKVKELTVDPGKSLSMQRHQFRSELWFVGEGEAMLNWDYGGKKIKLYKQETINVNEWHQLENKTDKPLKIIEIQYGESCTEEDIERR